MVHLVESGFGIDTCREKEASGISTRQNLSTNWEINLGLYMSFSLSKVSVDLTG